MCKSQTVATSFHETMEKWQFNCIELRAVNEQAYAARPTKHFEWNCASLTRYREKRLRRNFNELATSARKKFSHLCRCENASAYLLHRANDSKAWKDFSYLMSCLPVFVYISLFFHNNNSCPLPLPCSILDFLFSCYRSVPWCGSR